MSTSVFYHQAVTALFATFNLLNTTANGIGGTLSIVVARRMPNLDSSTKLCMVSLAIADMLTIWPFLATFVAILAQQWPFGPEVCILSKCMLDAASFASVAFIAALSVDRYMVITRPLYYTQKKAQRVFKISAALLWAVFGLAFIFATSFMVVPGLEKDGEEEPSNRTYGTYCVILMQEPVHTRRWYAIILSVLVGIPGLLICTIYARLLFLGRKHALRIHQQNPKPQNHNAESGRRGYKTFAAVTLCFALTSVPYVASVVYGVFFTSNPLEKPQSTIIVWCKFLFNAHGWLNALVYIFLNRCFRQEAKKVLVVAWQHTCKQQVHPAH